MISEMVGAGMRLPSFCMSRGGNTARVRVCTQTQQQYRQSYSSIIYTEDKAERCSSNNSIEMNFNPNGGVGDMLNSESEAGNRVMVVIDSGLDAQGALQWALSHTVQSQDTIVLLHVSKPSKQESNSQKAHELLSSMKDMCEMRRPGVHVETSMVEGKEKGPTIVEEAKQQKASLLVLGQKKRSMVRRLRRMWTTGQKRSRGKVVEDCIQNASCMTIAVRRKSSNCGGYLITTKRHKNFWLLA
ncbi:unnamed protein product [Camellia sinensis]